MNLALMKLICYMKLRKVIYLHSSPKYHYLLDEYALQRKFIKEKIS